MTYTKKLADDCWAVFYWNGKDWSCSRACFTQRAARNQQARLRRNLRRSA
jgi:hypothetical protein